VKTQKLLSRLIWLVSMPVSILVVWQLIIWVFAPEPWLFPPPADVWTRYRELASNGILGPNVMVTAIEVLAGYGLGISTGLLTGYPISQIRWLEKLATPYLIAANSIPLVAFAPLLLLWLGNGIWTKIIVAALIVYFPITVSTIAGFHSVSPIHGRLMFTLRARKWQRFLYLELPAAIPAILAGMKIAAPLAVVGAVVGELLGTGEGLGHMILEANGLLDTPQLFVAIIILALFGIGFYLSTVMLERLLIGPWQRKRRIK